MSDDLVRYLLSGGGHSSTTLDSNTLKLMGKQAAAKFFNDGTFLTDAVTSLAEETPGIQAEHVSRICEFANIEVNSQLFDKLASEQQGGLVYTDFQPASPARVMQNLAGDAKLASLVVDSPEYNLSPESVLGRGDCGDDLLEQMFLGDILEKGAAEGCDTPGEKIRSKGKGRGLAIGKGKGPLRGKLQEGVEKTAVAGLGGAVFSHPVRVRGTIGTVPMDDAGNKTGYVPSPAFLSEFVGADKSQLVTIDSDREHPDIRDRIQETTEETGNDKMGSAISKTAAVLDHLEQPENPHHNLFRLRTEVEGNKEAVASQYGFMDLRAREAWNSFYGHVKEAVVGGTPFNEIYDATFSVCDGDAEVHQATMRPVAEHLMVQKVASAQDLAAGHEKVGSTFRIPNPDSELLSSYAAFLEFSTERAKLAGIANALGAELQEIDEFVRHHLRSA